MGIGRKLLARSQRLRYCDVMGLLRPTLQHSYHGGKHHYIWVMRVPKGTPYNEREKAYKRLHDAAAHTKHSNKKKPRVEALRLL
jgi:hypothetical protein